MMNVDVSSGQKSPYLQIENLWKSFGDFVALKNITMNVQEGELLCFLGPSGCGKTTLLRAIAGLELQSSGTIEQAGIDVSNLPPSERDFGIVFQSYALFPNLTIFRNIAYGLENVGRSKNEIKDRVSELLELVGLSEQGEKYPAQLSGGQQQRIALARAIATSPGLLLLDEPLSALDAQVRVHLRHELKQLQHKLGITTVMVTHDQEEALSMADRIVIMRDGMIEQIGTPIDIYKNPKTLFVAGFIGEMNKIVATVGSENSFKIGNLSLECAPHNYAIDAEVVATIRPEDIIPHGSGARSPGAADTITNPRISFEAEIVDMEFLGAFWRAELSGDNLSGQILSINLSINAVRRMSLNIGSNLQLELPPENIRLYPTNFELLERE
ncbi:MAG: putative 2-aminoethylphosphonate ABC transporter ATP-binding protein [Rhizobiales bacterium]|nr:putative 2-aminoethylphosphonate ABC transporter ATP-binding protein [Hyphomicrobiales bacterium]